MRITKEIAKSVAFRMTEKKRKELDLLNKNLSELAYELALSKINKSVIESFNKHKKYFKTFSSFKVIGNGFNYEYFSFNNKLPCEDIYSVTYEFDVKNSKKLLDLLNEKNKLSEDLIKLRNDIEIALIGLKTYNKIESEFKEAFVFLPIKVSTELTVNIDKIREKL